MRVLIHLSHCSAVRPDGWSGAPGEAAWVRDLVARMVTSLQEEAEAIGWYQQRISVEKDPEARAIMTNAQHEEFKHFGMDLEFLTRKLPVWRTELQGILFKPGDIVKNAEAAEKKAD